jgi:hypothetical protein
MALLVLVACFAADQILSAEHLGDPQLRGVKIDALHLHRHVDDRG